MRLFVVVEGQTEEAFVKSVLQPHLSATGVFTSASIVGKKLAQRRGHNQRGGGSYLGGWKPDIVNFLKSNHQRDVRVTTLFDLYGLPTDFPGFPSTLPDGGQRATALETAMAADIGDHRFMPFLMKYEFEALVLAALPQLKMQLSQSAQRSGVDALIEEIREKPPEDVNDGETTAPSKRLLRSVPGYSKTVHGPTALTGVGLDHLRSQCPRFNGWLTQLEALSQA